MQLLRHWGDKRQRGEESKRRRVEKSLCGLLFTVYGLRFSLRNGELDEFTRIGAGAGINSPCPAGIFFSLPQSGRNLTNLTKSDKYKLKDLYRFV